MKNFTSPHRHAQQYLENSCQFLCQHEFDRLLLITSIICENVFLHVLHSTMNDEIDTELIE